MVTGIKPAKASANFFLGNSLLQSGTPSIHITNQIFKYFHQPYKIRFCSFLTITNKKY